MPEDQETSKKYRIELIVIIALMIIVGAFIAVQVLPRL